MQPEHSARLEHILAHISVGIAILNCSNQRILYANPYLLSLLPEPWRSQNIVDHQLSEVLPEELLTLVPSYIQQVQSTGKSMVFSDLAYEGFLETRGRTYWQVSFQLAPPLSSISTLTQPSMPDNKQQSVSQNKEQEIYIIIEDVTNSVRSRLYLEAVHHISSTIAGPFALPQVLDSILQAVQELVGSTRCAVLLIDDPIVDGETYLQGPDEALLQETFRTKTKSLPTGGGVTATPAIPTVTIAAQKGLFLTFQKWHQQLNEQLLLGQIVHNHHTLIITDTSASPEIELPLLDDSGMPRRPGSVLCVPIFEPTSRPPINKASVLLDEKSDDASPGAVIGTIEVYHRRARGFPAEEVELLEQFAQQAGLAIQNARFYLRMNRLAESARMRLLLERLPSGVMLVSADDKPNNVVNHQAVELLQRMGWMPQNNPTTNDAPLEQTLQTMNIEALLRTLTFYGDTGSIIPYEEQPLFLALHKGEASEAELHLTQPDGQNLFLLINAAPLRNITDTITNAVLVWHDITRLKALERTREDFFTTMAHEIKTPLANIRAHLSALQARDLQLSQAEQHTFLATADEQVDRLVRMINHFLDASRVEAGALRLEVEPILVPEMFEDLQDRLEALITSSHRQLQISVPPSLPSVLADYELIMNVLTNLLSNAFRYAPEGDTVILEARQVIKTSESDNAQHVEVEIRVTDRGPGVNQELQSELFTRFSTFAAQRRPDAYRPGQPIPEKRRSNKRWSPATGLGLYISRGIIEAHGSQLRLESNPGQGATFAFTLAIASTAQKRLH